MYENYVKIKCCIITIFFGIDGKYKGDIGNQIL